MDDQDVQVLSDAASVQTDFSRSISPKLSKCLAYQLEKLQNVTGVDVKRVPFPAIGTVSAVYRAVVDVPAIARYAAAVAELVITLAA